MPGLLIFRNLWSLLFLLARDNTSHQPALSTDSRTLLLIIYTLPLSSLFILYMYRHQIKTLTWHIPGFDEKLKWGERDDFENLSEGRIKYVQSVLGYIIAPAKKLPQPVQVAKAASARPYTCSFRFYGK